MKYFSIRELCKSTTASNKGIDNTPTKEVEDNLTKLVDNILDPLRERYGKPIIVTSGYRCKKLNTAVGGSAGSQHMLGQAVDIRTVSDKFEDNKQLFDLIIAMNLPFDQLIWEYGYKSKGPDWIHVSYGPKNRKQILYIGVK